MPNPRYHHGGRNYQSPWRNGQQYTPPSKVDKRPTSHHQTQHNNSHTTGEADVAQHYNSGVSNGSHYVSPSPPFSPSSSRPQHHQNQSYHQNYSGGGGGGDNGDGIHPSLSPSSVSTSTEASPSNPLNSSDLTPPPARWRSRSTGRSSLSPPRESARPPGNGKGNVVHPRTPPGPNGSKHDVDPSPYALSPADGLSAMRDGSHATILKLRNALDEAHARDESAKASLARSDATILELRRNVQELREELNRSEEDRTTLASRQGNADGELANLRKEVQVSRKVIEDRERTLYNLQNKLSRINMHDEELGELQIKLDRAEGGLLTEGMMRKEMEDRHREEVRGWDIVLEQERNRIEELKGELSKRDRTIESLEGTVEDVEGKLRDAKSLYGRNRDVSELKGTVTSQQSKLEELEAELEDKEARLDMVRDEKRTMEEEHEAKVSKLQSEIEILKLDLENETAKHADLGREQAKIETERMLHDASVDKLNDELNAARITLKERDVELKEKNKRLIQLKRRLERSDGKCKEMEKEVDELKKALEGKDEQVRNLSATQSLMDADEMSDLRSQNADLASITEERDKEIDKLHKRITSLEEERDELRKCLNDAMQELELVDKEVQAVHELHVEKDRLTKRADDLEKSLETRNAELLSLKQKLADAEAVAGGKSPHDEVDGSPSKELRSRRVKSELRLRAQLGHFMSELHRGPPTDEMSMGGSLKSGGVRSDPLSPGESLRDNSTEGAVVASVQSKSEFRDEKEGRVAAVATATKVDNVTLRLQINEHREKIAHLEAQLSATRGELKTKEESAVELRKNLKEAVGLLKPLQDHAATSEREKMELKGELNRAKEQVGVLENELAEATRVAILRDEVSSPSDESGNGDTAKRSMSRRDLLQELEAAKESLSMLTAQEEEVERFRKEVESLEQALEKSASETARMKAELTKHQNAAARAMPLVAEKETQISRLKSEVADLEKALEVSTTNTMQLKEELDAQKEARAIEIEMAQASRGLKEAHAALEAASPTATSSKRSLKSSSELGRKSVGPVDLDSGMVLDAESGLPDHSVWDESDGPSEEEEVNAAAIQAVQAEVVRLEKELKNSKEDLNDSRSSELTLKQQLHDAQTKLNTLHRQNKQLATDKQILSERLVESEEQVDFLERKVETKNADLAKANADLAEATTGAAVAASPPAQKQQQLASDAALSGRERELRLAEGRVSELEDQVEQYRDELKSKEDGVTRLQEELRQSQLCLSAVADGAPAGPPAGSQELRAGLSEEERGRTQQEIDELKSSVLQSTQELDQVKMSLELANEHVSELEAELSAAQGDAKARKDSEKVLNKSLKEALGLLKPMQGYVETAEEEKIELEKQLADCKQRIEELEAAVLDMEANTTSRTENSMRSAIDEIELLQKKENLETKVRCLEEEVSELTDSLSRQGEEHSAGAYRKELHQAEHNILKEKVEKLEGHLVEIKSRYEVTQSMFREATHTNESLLDDLKQMELEEKETAEELQILRAKLRVTEDELHNAKYIATTALMKVEELTVAAESHRTSSLPGINEEGDDRTEEKVAEMHLSIEALEHQVRLEQERNEILEESIREKDRILSSLTEEHEPEVTSSITADRTSITAEGSTYRSGGSRGRSRPITPTRPRYLGNH